MFIFKFTFVTRVEIEHARASLAVLVLACYSRSLQHQDPVSHSRDDRHCRHAFDGDASALEPDLSGLLAFKTCDADKLCLLLPAPVRISANVALHLLRQQQLVNKGSQKPLIFLACSITVSSHHEVVISGL